MYKRKETVYMIKPLKWIKGLGEEYIAMTPFGEYKIYKHENQWYWGYEFDEYYNEQHLGCKSLEDGKNKAQAHWTMRLEQCLLKRL